MNERIQVLLVEDNTADADLTLEALESARVKIDLSVVVNGFLALAYLRNQAPYESARRPDLVLLDLNLPCIDGREVLQSIKSDPLLKMIPVVILTSSETETDIVRSYQLGANCYVTKPLDLRAFQTIVAAVESFWFTVVKLPRFPKDREDLLHDQ